MRAISTFLFVLLFTSSFAFAQDLRNETQRPTSFDNPFSVSGPTLEAPLATFYESFEGVTFPPAGWVKYNPDAGTGWTRITAGTTPLPGWTGGTATSAPVAGSGTGLAYATYTTGGATSNDQWLVTPQIMNVQSGDSLKFWIRVFSNLYADEVQVKISTTGNAIANFTTTVANLVYAAADTGWYSYAYKLGDFVPNGSNIYIAFREVIADNFNDGDAIFLDEVKIVQGVTPPVFFDNFDSYTVGNFVACSNPTGWTTWSNAPCGAEDALVSNEFAYSGTNSAKIITNDDLVKKFGTTAFTSGKYKISFRAYIPAGKAGYFNTLATFAGSNSSWGLDVYFNTTGVCSVFAGSTTAITSATYPIAAWFLVEHIVDLTANQSQLIVNGVSVHTWQWTLGSTGSGCPLTLDATDLFGATANDVMYVDNYTLENLTVVPVELTSFTATTNNRNVNLNWSTATEINNQGFEIERRLSEGQFITIGHVNGNGTTTERKEYSFTDAGVQSGSYAYRLKQIDFDGTFEYSSVVEIEVLGVNEFSLGQNYPNPFNPTTSISFSLAEPSFVKLAVFNLLGEEVQVLKNEYMNAGSFNVSFDASSLPSGMYLYKIESAQFTSVRKMMLMK